MVQYSKRTVVTLRPEWEPMLDQLKKDRFYNDTQAEMFRYLIARGLESLKTENKVEIRDDEKSA